MSREGYEISNDALKRDWSKTYNSNKSVKNAWLSIYQNPSNENQLFKLGESLIEFDEQFSIYRWRHFVLVKKIIGYKSGTGGSSGVDYFDMTTKYRVFVDLWAVRSILIKKDAFPALKNKEFYEFRGE